MKKVSIIVPMYNVENYITKCIDSLINQTYSNIEIILIDDGSKDATFQIIKNFKDKRIKYIYQKNAGVSAARNNGISKSSGDYITFIDADDWLSQDAIKTMVDLFDSECDVVRTNYYNVKYLENKIDISENRKVISDYYLTLQDVIQGKINCYVWVMMLKKKCVENIKFNLDLPMMEDNYFYFELLKSGFRIKCFDIPTYYYFNNLTGASLNVNNYKKNIDSMLKLYDLIDSNIEDKDKIYNDTNITKCILAILKDVYKLLRKDFEQLYNYLKNMYFCKNLKIEKSRFNITEKIMFFTIKHNFKNFLKMFLTFRIFVSKLLK